MTDIYNINDYIQSIATKDGYSVDHATCDFPIDQHKEQHSLHVQVIHNDGTSEAYYELLSRDDRTKPYTKVTIGEGATLYYVLRDGLDSFRIFG